MTVASSLLHLNNITYGGGGGLFGPDHQIINRNFETDLAPPNLVTFCFYLLDTFWQNFSKNRFARGFAAVVFVMRHLEKLNL